MSYSQDQFGTIQNLQSALIPQTSNWSGTIFGGFLQQTGCSFEIFFNLMWPIFEGGWFHGQRRNHEKN